MIPFYDGFLPNHQGPKSGQRKLADLDALDLILIQANDPDADEFGYVVFDFVRLFIRFEFVLIFSLKFFDALFFIFDPSFDFRHLPDIRPIQQRTDDSNICLPGILKDIPVAVVEFQEGVFFSFQSSEMPMLTPYPS
jgi:hypothetical protein